MAVKVKSEKLGRVERMSFAKIKEALEMPNLIEIQKDSYRWFINEGIREVFKDVSGITDINRKLSLSFVDYRMDDPPKYSIAECKERDVTYAVPLKVKARLRNNETGEVVENEIYMGDFPLMTNSGTFVINGAERVIVSQLVRSPGVYYGFDYDKTGKKLFRATVIPNRGAWLEYEMDSNDVVYVRIDKNRKIPITTLLRAFGVGSDDELEQLFGDDERVKQSSLKDGNIRNTEDALIEVYKKLRPGEPPTVESAQTHIDMLFFDPKRYDLSRFGRYKYNKKLGVAGRINGQRVSRTVVDPLTGEILAESGDRLSLEKALEIDRRGVMEVFVFATAELESSTDGEAAPQREVKVLGNGMVNIRDFIAEDADWAKLGINEKVSFPVLKALIEELEDKPAA